MKNIIILLFFTISFSSNSQNIEIKNASWFNGIKFQKENIFIKNGKFTFYKPDTIHKIINLNDKFILPPYGETHTHNLSNNYGIDYLLKEYKNQGILYIQVLGGSQKGEE
ncbi:hypothetical protein [Polaribacter porphyrae]|uniref:Amidohydrolase n=1 Tax=Polaribacter porphyrae TaxID=1137780 RepID=A0A2S7WNT4_9FLAO|nr:hypothetical protein [Polaribacter porphyrae]PQJ79278.1 hypothetical protein BTO18_08875 [Polaribacter porphyrae]